MGKGAGQEKPRVIEIVSYGNFSVVKSFFVHFVGSGFFNLTTLIPLPFFPLRKSLFLNSIVLGFPSSQMKFSVNLVDLS